MFEQPPGWTADKERERIRNLTAAYFAAKEDLDESTVRVLKLSDQRIDLLTWGTLIGLGGLLIHWFVSLLVGAFLALGWRFMTKELRSTEQSVAHRRERMKQLREYLEQVGLSPHSPWTVEKDGQVLGFVPRYEPEL